jgi:two-component system sensor histidine kinase TctE
MFKSPSLRNRLILGLLIPLILLRFISGHLHASDLEQRVRMLQDSYLDDTLRGLERAVSELPLEQVPTRLSKILLVVQKSHINDMRYAVRSLPTGKVLAGEAWEGEHPIENTPTFRDAIIDGKEFRIVSKSLNFAPTLGVEIARESSVATGVLEDSWEYLFLVQTLMILLVVLVVSVVIRKNFGPLNSLVQEVEQRGLKNLRPLQPPMVPAEVAPIIRTINRAFARLQQERDNQQSFLELASHQLKTPVAGMRATVDDLIRQGVLSVDKPETQRLNLSLDRMQSLCEKLMGLLRVTSQQLEELPTYGESTVDALEGAKSVIETLYPLALKRGVDLGLHSEPEGVKSIDFPCTAEAYNELLAILVDNAIRYSPPGGHVDVVVTRAPIPTISVVDSGPGIPPELREKVFERFFRILGSGEDGSGLGLSIAKEICSRNHLKIYVDDSPTGVGAKFVVVSESPASEVAGDNTHLDS